jgi:predicted nucleotide-binding protein
MTKPSIFIGSSSEGLEIARAIEFQLKDVGEITIWNEGVFGLGLGTLESLVNALERFDFAILALTPDDFTVSRNVPTSSPRDNVMFELGLFMGRLGRSRTFIVYDVSTKLKIPSDLAGVILSPLSVQPAHSFVTL